MTYTFQISDTTPESKRIINMLLDLSKDNNILQVVEGKYDEFELTTEQESELDRRYAEFQKNPRNGKAWNDVRKKVLQ